MYSKFKFPFEPIQSIYQWVKCTPYAKNLGILLLKKISRDMFK